MKDQKCSNEGYFWHQRYISQSFYDKFSFEIVCYENDYKNAQKNLQKHFECTAAASDYVFQFVKLNEMKGSVSFICIFFADSFIYICH